jgi:hypothetical protein
VVSAVAVHDEAHVAFLDRAGFGVRSVGKGSPGRVVLFRACELGVDLSDRALLIGDRKI